jgi:WD40 repeat protein
MLIFGSKSEETPFEAGTFHCPNCQVQCSYRRTSSRRWFTVFFIPVFPLGGANDLTECQTCFQKFQTAGLTSLPGEQQVSDTDGVVMAQPVGSGLATGGRVIGYSIFLTSIFVFGFFANGMSRGVREGADGQASRLKPAMEELTFPKPAIEEPHIPEQFVRESIIPIWNENVSSPESEDTSADESLSDEPVSDTDLQIREPPSFPPELFAPIETKETPSPFYEPVSGSNEFEPSPNVSFLFVSPSLGWPFTSLAFTPDGKSVICGKFDSKLLGFDLANGESMSGPSHLRTLGRIGQLAVSRDSEFLFAAGSEGRILRFDLGDAEIGTQWEELAGHKGEITALESSKTAALLLSGSRHGDLVWQSYDQESSRSRSLQAHERSVLAVHLPENGVIGQSTDGRSVVRFHLKAGDVVEQTELSNGWPLAASFNSDGSKIAVCGHSKVHVFDSNSGAQEAELQTSNQDRLLNVLFHPNQQWVVAGGIGTVIIWDKASGEVVETYRVDEGYIKNLAISADGSQLALAQRRGGSVKVIQLPNEGVAR